MRICNKVSRSRSGDLAHKPGMGRVLVGDDLFDDVARARLCGAIRRAWPWWTLVSTGRAGDRAAALGCAEPGWLFLPPNVGTRVGCVGVGGADRRAASGWVGGLLRWLAGNDEP